MDFIDQINPPLSKGHHFVLVATDYFTKWTEAVSLKNMTHKEVIEFITEHIIHRFGIPQTLTTDQGSSFISKEVHAFAESYKIKWLLRRAGFYWPTMLSDCFKTIKDVKNVSDLVICNWSLLR